MDFHAIEVFEINNLIKPEPGLFHTVARPADHDVELARFANIIQIIIVEFQQRRVDLEIHFPALARFERYTLKSLQFLNRAC